MANSTNVANFASLNLDPQILTALIQCGYDKPTSIQEKAIPVALQGKDIIGTAQTGTGKTAAFVLPILQLLLTTEKQGKPRVLVLTPTRELANQVTDAAEKYGKNLRFNIVSILGGMPFGAQFRQLKRPVDILIATPGRLIDHMERGSIDLSAVKMLVLDEADRMLDMGFIDDVEYIAKATPAKRQTLLFTATLGNRLVKLANNILHEPERIEIAGKKMTLDSIEQRIHFADDDAHKNRLLQHLIGAEDVDKAIIFSATKRNADKLARQLYELGHEAGALHGDMNQHKRNQAIKRFHSGDLRVLVATDVAARGIDVRGVSHVINYDLPKFAEDYVHRIGRTGRAGKSGIAISLVMRSDNIHLNRIERFTGHKISASVIAGLEPTRASRTQDDKPKQDKNKRRDFRGGGGGRFSNNSNSRDGYRPPFKKGNNRNSNKSRGDSRAY